MMRGRSLKDCRVLVVEDEYMLADEIRGALLDAGATVVGPVGSLADAIELTEKQKAEIDVAVLDANLQGEMVFPLAETLSAAGVPFLFTTGYDASAIPARFSAVSRLEKPTSMAKLCKAVAELWSSSR
jgi:DNA-binding response OmpR family regulator